MDSQALTHFIQTIGNLDDGVHVFSLKNGTTVHTDSTPQVPLLTMSGEPEDIRRLVDCFSCWDGDVRVAALQDEGLLDVWAF